MESSETSISWLEAQFDQLLKEIKPHVLKLSRKNDRQMCATWIKKFYEPTGSTITAKKNRNLYAQLLLCMLKQGSVEGPFLTKPEFGPLPSFPSHLSVYFNNSNASSFTENKVPDWVTVELQSELPDSPVNTTRRVFDEPYARPRDSDDNHEDMRVRFAMNNADMDRRHSRTKLPFEDQFLAEENLRIRPFQHTGSAAYRPQAVFEVGRDFSLDTFASGLRDDATMTRSQTAEMEIRTKMIESKFQEESLKLQHQHDCNVKKILDRKNAEIEEIKQHYQNKSQERESAVSQLEKKICNLQRELSSVQEMRDHQVAELQRLTEENVSSKQTLLDKKLHDMAMTHEQQKYDLQKRHTMAIQELMDETNVKLGKMQVDYDNLTESTSSIIKELESRVHQLSLEVESVSKVRHQLEQRKSDLEMLMEKLQTELSDSQTRLAVKEKELTKLRADHEAELRSLKNKHDVALESLRNDRRIADSKSSEVVHSLETQISELKQRLVDAREQFEKEVRELEVVHHQDKQQLDQLQQTKIANMQQKLDQQEKQCAKKVKKFEQLLSQKDSDIHRLTMSQIEQAELSQRTLDEFKGQVEKNSERMYDEMKLQLEKVEADLNRSKQSRDKLSRDSERQREELLRVHAEQIAELRIKLEMEKARHVEDLHSQSELHNAQKAKELGDLRDTLSADIADVERRAKERIEKDAKLRTQMEVQLQRLRDELADKVQQHKQELVELRFARDQEVHSMEADFHSQLSKLKSQMEEQRLEMERRHSLDMEKLLDNTNVRLRELESDYATRGSRSAETICDLQNTIEKLKDEINRQRHESEHRLASVDKSHTEEKNSLNQQYLNHISTVQRELSVRKEEIARLEHQLCQQQLDEDEKMTRVRSQYEERLKGMVKAEVRQELEDAISSLRMQVSVLQQRAALLQEDLDERNSKPLVALFNGLHNAAASAAVPTS